MAVMARHRTSRMSHKNHKPKASYSDVKAPTRDRRSHKGQRLNIWKESDMRGALDKWKAGTQKNIRKLAFSWNVLAATLFRRTKKDVLKSEHMSGRNTVLNEAQEAQLVD